MLYVTASQASLKKHILEAIYTDDAYLLSNALSRVETPVITKTYPTPPQLSQASTTVCHVSLQSCCPNFSGNTNQLFFTAVVFSFVCWVYYCWDVSSMRFTVFLLTSSCNFSMTLFQIWLTLYLKPRYSVLYDVTFALQ